eukprot:31368-Pelagococcus_subviridis.AAC.15
MCAAFQSLAPTPTLSSISFTKTDTGPRHASSLLFSFGTGTENVNTRRNTAPRTCASSQALSEAIKIERNEATSPSLPS